MLYDILPPIFLFSSLSGIILTISRVMLRVRRQQFPEQAPVKADDIAINEDQIFKPEKTGISMFKNRLAYLPHLARQTASQTTTFLKDKKSALGGLRERRRQQQEPVHHAEESSDYPAGPLTVFPDSDVSTSEEQNITMPHSAWREKIGAVKNLKGLGRSLLSQAQKIRPRRATNTALSEESAITDLGENSPPRTAENPETTPKPQAQPSPSAASKPAHHLVLRRVKNSLSIKSKEKSQSKVMSRLGGSQAVKSPGKSILEQASDAIASAKYNRAEDILLPYIIKHARDAQAYMLLGQTALGQHDWSEAIEIFQQVLKISPSEPGAHAALGYAALKAGRFTLALQTLQRAHEQDPQDLEVLKQLLRIAQRMDNSVLKRSVSEKITALHSSGQFH